MYVYVRLHTCNLFDNKIETITIRQACHPRSYFANTINRGSLCRATLNRVMIGRKIFPQEESIYVYLLNSSNIKTLVTEYLGEGVKEWIRPLIKNCPTCKINSRGV